MLNINDIAVTKKPTIYCCYGLGSCIGLFVVDRVAGLSGGAHIAVPSSIEANTFAGASLLINKLLASFQEYGSNLTGLRSKVTGGAQIYENSLNIGKQNVDSVWHELVHRKIYIAAADVGGTVSRTACFNTITETLEISTSGQKTYFI
jgi:chemotaxis protein CheD